MHLVCTEQDLKLHYFDVHFGNNWYLIRLESMYGFMILERKVICTNWSIMMVVWVYKQYLLKIVYNLNVLPTAPGRMQLGDGEPFKRRGLVGSLDSLRVYLRAEVEPGPFLVFTLLFHIPRPYCDIFPLAQLLLEQTWNCVKTANVN